MGNFETFEKNTFAIKVINNIVKQNLTSKQNVSFNVIVNEIRTMQGVTVREIKIDASSRKFNFIYGGVEFTIEYDNLKNNITVTPNIQISYNLNSGVQRYESENFIVFKIDCQIATDCIWNHIFKDELSCISALNVDSYFFELGSSCWWDNKKDSYSYILIDKRYFKDRENFISDYLCDEITHIGKLEYALLTDDHCTVGYIWNGNNAQVFFRDYPKDELLNVIEGIEYQLVDSNVNIA